MILTQALLNNYGCLLQNYALQKVLKNMGCDVLTVDFRQKNYYVPLIPVLINRALAKILNLFGFRLNKKTIPRFQKRKPQLDLFVKENIKLSNPVSKYSAKIIRKYRAQAFVVGSDQVWRPKFNHYLEDMYLQFTNDHSVKRIAYAASFGVDEWEYTAEQTRGCSALAKKFDSISVREESGVKLCKEHLGVDAAWVLDPTLLLDKSDYLDLCKDIPEPSEKHLAAYVLGMNEDVQRTCEKIANEKGLILKVFSADSKVSLSVPEWLAMFRDASYVVTDSFHGTVFSIIFGKEFKCIYNEVRGAARFESLLNLYYSGKLEEKRQFSLNWLKNALET